ncbi:unnamed protein product [Protopolystoma xenopodis]|nr:unnamed protein product [Protopolystoma xenopodis]
MPLEFRFDRTLRQLIEEDGRIACLTASDADEADTLNSKVAQAIFNGLLHENLHIFAAQIATNSTHSLVCLHLLA